MGDLLAASRLSLPLILLIAVLAFLVALWATPVARAAAIRFGIVDRPDGRLKHQREPVPYLGGLAVYLAVLVGLLLVVPSPSGGPEEVAFGGELTALLLAGALVLLLGLIDDLGALTPRVKFLGQFLAAWVMVKAGVTTAVSTLPPWGNAAVTVFWMIAVMNAVNIIDIMDGLASAVAAAAAAVLVVVALLNELPLVAATAAAVMGAASGFLVYNRSPARIYLGDSGSLFLGLMLGGLSMIVRYSSANELAVLNPLVILAVPLFDTGFVSCLRMYRGDSPFRGSPDHFALRLRKKGWSANKVALASASTTLLCGVLAILNMGLEWPESLTLFGMFATLLLGVALWLGRERMP